MKICLSLYQIRRYSYKTKSAAETGSSCFSRHQESVITLFSIRHNFVFFIKYNGYFFWFRAGNLSNDFHASYIPMSSFTFSTGKTRSSCTLVPSGKLCFVCKKALPALVLTIFNSTTSLFLIVVSNQKPCRYIEL